MTDYHIHIGQFREATYNTEPILKALKVNGVDEFWFSSTTSCICCKESEAAQRDKTLCASAPSASELYQNIRAEVRHALDLASGLGIKAHALYWVVPDIHFAEKGGVSVKDAMGELAYDGFKLHPRSQKWDLNDVRTLSLAHEVFSYAESHGMPILIHSDEDFPPDIFEPLFAAYPKVSVQLAHCKEADPIIRLLSKYGSLTADTAFCSAANYEAICAAGFRDRMRFGTDLPVTHYYEHLGDDAPTPAQKWRHDETQLAEHYARVLKDNAMGGN